MRPAADILRDFDGLVVKTAAAAARRHPRELSGHLPDLCQHLRLRLWRAIPSRRASFPWPEFARLVLGEGVAEYLRRQEYAALKTPYRRRLLLRRRPLPDLTREDGPPPAEDAEEVEYRLSYLEPAEREFLARAVLGDGVKAISRETGAPEATLYAWRRDLLRQLRELES